MSIVTEEQTEILKILLPEMVELAIEHDNLVMQDKDTLRIMARFLGVGFAIGMVYEETQKGKPYRERLSEAFRILKKRKK